MSSRDGAPSFCASFFAGPPLTDAVEPLELPPLELELDEELLEPELDDELLLGLEVLLLELELLLPLLEPLDLLVPLKSETLLPAPPGVAVVSTPPHAVKTAVAKQAATIVIFFKQKFAISTNVSTGMITLCPRGESIATRRNTATVAECRRNHCCP